MLQFLQRKPNIDKPPNHKRESYEAIANHGGLVREENKKPGHDKGEHQNKHRSDSLSIFCLQKRIREEQRNAAHDGYFGTERDAF